MLAFLSRLVDLTVGTITEKLMDKCQWKLRHRKVD